MTREVDWNALIAEEKERMSGNCPAEDLYAPVFEMKTAPSMYDRGTREQIEIQAALYRMGQHNVRMLDRPAGGLDVRLKTFEQMKG